MGHERERYRGRAAEERQDQDGSEQVATPSFAGSLQRVVQALTGDTKHVREFRAGPAAFLRRHAIDVRQPQGASAMAALSELTAERAGAARPADPSGESRATDAVVVAPSNIHGDGVFAEAGLQPGEPVCDVAVGAQVSYTASKVNQSTSPNTEMVNQGGHLVVTTMRTVQPGEELVADYPLLDDAGKAAVKDTLPPPRSA